MFFRPDRVTLLFRVVFFRNDFSPVDPAMLIPSGVDSDPSRPRCVSRLLLCSSFEFFISTITS